MKERTPLVAGNWKMLGDAASNTALLDRTRSAFDGGNFARIQALICPPFPYLALAADRLRSSPVVWGAQDVSDQAEGAFTGEVSANMLRDLGCSHAIVGHSERRGMHGETDTVVASKAHRLIDAGICPIICVGESLAQRQSHLTEAVLAHQIDAVVGVVKGGAAVIAYEPIWAIGSGRSATPEMAQAAHAFIRARLQAGGAPADQIRVIYGGSVGAASASALFVQPDIDGALVGGASRNADDFVAICESATQAKL